MMKYISRVSKCVLLCDDWTGKKQRRNNSWVVIYYVVAEEVRMAIMIIITVSLPAGITPNSVFFIKDSLYVTWSQNTLLPFLIATVITMHLIFYSFSSSLFSLPLAETYYFRHALFFFPFRPQPCRKMARIQSS